MSTPQITVNRPVTKGRLSDVTDTQLQARFLTKSFLKERSTGREEPQGDWERGAMNNNMLTERAHLGVFQTSSYISIGDTYAKKADKDPRLGGKQFAADFPKDGIGGARPNNALFEREHKWLYGGEKFIDRTSYIKTQPPDQRKKGFQSSDASRRDEFTLDVEVRAAGAGVLSCAGLRGLGRCVWWGVVAARWQRALLPQQAGMCGRNG